MSYRILFYQDTEPAENSGQVVTTFKEAQEIVSNWKGAEDALYSSTWAIAWSDTGDILIKGTIEQSVDTREYKLNNVNK